MTLKSIPQLSAQDRRHKLACATGKISAALLATSLLLATVLRSDQPPADSVGAIEGADIAVKGPVSIDIANGRSRTVLSNGSEVTVKSGPARLDLVEGGVIGICGPAHFSLLKAGGMLTIALDYGLVHARLTGNPKLTVFTPLVQASLVDIGGAPRDATIGLEINGTMCVHATSGAARLEQQLTGQTFLVPQGGEINLNGGQLDATLGSTAACGCEIAVAKNSLPLPTRSTGLSALAPATEFRPNPPAPEVHPNPPAPQAVYAPEKRKDEFKAESGNSAGKIFEGNDSGKRGGPPAIEQPIYKVLMPPLTFDASAPMLPPDPSPATILLVRTVRLRPTIVFRGHVESAPAAAALPPASTQSAQNRTLAPQNKILPAQNNTAKSESAESQLESHPSGPQSTGAADGSARPTVMAKVRNFFHRLIRK